MGVEQLAASGLLRKAPRSHESTKGGLMILWGGGKGVFSLSRVPPCRLFLMGTGGETKVAFLAAVRGGELLSDLLA
jgi:hypothetical protein